MPNTSPEAKKPTNVSVPAPGQLEHYSGSKSREFTNRLLNATIDTAWLPNLEDAEAKRLQARIALDLLEAFKPTDAIEGMIAAQAVAMHQGAMECFRRAMIPDQPPDMATRMRKDGANLARGMTDMLDALDRKRGKGPQVVRVERVTVHQGGQAIVGNVQAGLATAASVDASLPPALEHEPPGLTLNGLSGPKLAVVNADRHRPRGGAGQKSRGKTP
jgi:hypothetical protein